MLFSEVKAAILLASRNGGYCEDHHTAKLASNYQELIDAGFHMFLHAWKVGALSTDILDEFDNDELQDNGIYYNRTGSYSSAPTYPKTFYDGYEIIIIGGTPIIDFPSTNKYKLTVINSNPIVNITDEAYLKLEVYNSAATINVLDNSMLNAIFENRNSEIINLNVDSEAAVLNDYQTILNINFGINSFVRLFSGKNSLAEVSIVEGDLRIFALKTQKSIINYASP